MAGGGGKGYWPDSATWPRGLTPGWCRFHRIHGFFLFALPLFKTVSNYVHKKPAYFKPILKNIMLARGIYYMFFMTVSPL